MTVADDEELYPAAALEIGRDLPLTFQYRTELSVIAELGLPDPRGAREDAQGDGGLKLQPQSYAALRSAPNWRPMNAFRISCAA